MAVYNNTGYTPLNQNEITSPIEPQYPNPKSDAYWKKDSVSKAVSIEKPIIPTESLLNLQNALIPLFDLDAIDQMSGPARAEHVQKFMETLEDIGFAAVKAESLTPLIAHVEEVMQAYFNRSLEEKMQDWNENNSLGYSQRGRETAAGSQVADLKETFFVPPGFTKWPKEMPQFEKAIEPYRQRLMEIAVQVMRIIAEGVNEPSEDVAESMQTAYNLLRLAHYPARKNGDDLNAVWAAPHEDLNAITLLPPSKVPGLQLMTKQGEWKAVSVPEGYLIVNTGEQLERKTAGYIRATRHQVLNPGGHYAQQSRYASIFFASWPPAFSLSPFKSCKERLFTDPKVSDKEACLHKFSNVSVQDNLDSRLIEMGTIANPSQEMVARLRGLGLLQQPPKALRELYPGYF